MNPQYNGVKYYSNMDLSTGWALAKAEPIIRAFDTNKEYDNINQVIELYNIERLLSTGVTLPDWKQGTLTEYRDIMRPVQASIGRFFAKICDQNFTEIFDQVAITYIDDFWTLIVQYKVYKRISKEAFLEFLMRPNTVLYRILYHKELVNTFDEQLATVLRFSDQTPHILASAFLEKTEETYYWPASLSPSEYENIFQKHMDSDNASPNLLQLLMYAQSKKECPISDKLKLNAKRASKRIFDNPKQHQIVQHIEQGVQITFTDQADIEVYEQNNFISHLSYDIKWLKENLDYPTIMNNFIYVFGMCDLCFRSTLVSVKSKISAIESIFSVKGVHHYPRGDHFRINEMKSSAQIHTYYFFLIEQGVHLEDAFVWFFDTYLPKEFNIEGFRMLAPTPTSTYIEKCRTLSSEMDGILKQFRMYATDGAIDRELFEMSSEQLKIDSVPSLITNKYMYAAGDAIQKEMYALFSDQALLSYIDRTGSKYSTLCELLANETVSVDEFKDFQLSGIKWLVNRGCITISEDNIVQLVYPRIYILKDLYNNDVLCPNHLKPFERIINQMVENGDIQVKSSLFSIPEADYMNYQLNKAKFSNGRDLRNKYAHSTYPSDENEQMHDYIELLKIMVLVIIKINEEFCLLADEKKGEGEV